MSKTAGWVIALLSMLLIVPGMSLAASRPAQIKIGVLAYRGADHALKTWEPTARYLETAIPDNTFKIIPLDFHEIDTAVGRGEVDFLLANSSIYVELENRFGISRIATMKNLANTGEGFSTVFGGVIFTRADRDDIRSLEDLRGKSFVAVDETSLGGWRVAWRELKGHGINPYRSFSSLTFAGTHDTAVMAVRDKRADAGTVRTDILESLEQSGKINLRDFRILNQEKHEDFPFISSTKLYPEWPFARLKHTPSGLSQQVAVSLMTLAPEAEAARAANIAGWTIPFDYAEVHELLKELNLAPYKNYGKVSPGQAVRQYWHVIAFGLLLIAAAIGTAVHMSKLNAGLIQARAAIDASQKDLEVKVDARTRELRTINEELEVEIVQKKKSEEALRESERRFRETLENANLIALQLDASGQILFANSYLAELTNWKVKDIMGRNWFDLFIPERERAGMQKLHRESSSGNFAGEYVNEILTRHGSRLLISWTNSAMLDAQGRFTGITALGMDITHRQQIEEHLLKTQKLEAIGTLAGGIAHDFNNLLQGIFGFISMAKLNSPKDSKAYRFLIEAEKNIDTATGLAGQLLTFSKGGAPVKKSIEVGPVIRKAVRLALSGSHNNHSVMLDDNLWQVEADIGQLSQVIQNIVTNADEAMPLPGTVKVTARNVTRDLPEKGNTRFVMISIEDTGGGMSEEVRTKAFDPYFTTKTMGSGLGLATAYSIVKNHGGLIEIDSEAGKGTRVQLLLRAAEAAAFSNSPAEAADEVKAMKILVMDDEEMVRRISCEMLKACGHETDVAENGDQAVEMYQKAMQSGRPYDGVILDLTISGGMGGEETNRRLLEIDPEAKTIISSGYSDGAAMAAYLELGFRGFLKKPYRIEQLQEVLSSLRG